MVRWRRTGARVALVAVAAVLATAMADLPPAVAAGDVPATADRLAAADRFATAERPAPIEPTAPRRTWGLDPTFAGVGYTPSVPQPLPTGGGVAVAVAPDGKHLVAGGSAGDVVVARFLTNGERDVSFHGGASVFDLGGGEAATAIAVQPDGKPVVVVSMPHDVLVLRLTASGELDPTFGTGGHVTSDLGVVAAARGVAVQPDGRIVVVGQADSSLFVARYTAAGALDTTFGAGTGRTIVAASPPSSGRAVIVEPGGTIVVGGTRGTAGAIARFTSTGALDTTFGQAGWAISSALFETVGQAMARQADGKLLLGGTGTFPFVSRFLAGGEVDVAFGGATPGTVPVIGAVDGLAVQSTGRILVASNFPGLVRVDGLTAAGALDPTFTDTNAIYSETYGPARVSGLAVRTDDSLALALTVATDQGTLLAGGTQGASGIGVHRASVDAASYDTVAAIASGSDGSTYAAGSRTTSGIGRATVKRLRVDGSLDLAFGIGGVVELGAGDGYSVVVQPDGKVLVGAATAPCGAVVHRLDSSGAPDLSFGTGGAVELASTGDTCSPRAPIVVGPAGVIYVPVGTDLVRLTLAGQPDATFGTAGSASMPADRATGGLVVQGDGKVVVSTIGGPLIRLLPSGALDTSYGVGGSAPIGAGSGPLALAPDGGVLVGDPSAFRVWKVSSTGTTSGLDGLFAPANGQPFDFSRAFGLRSRIDGTSPGAVRDLVVEPSGTVVVGGEIGGENALVHLLANGDLDPQFGDGGALFRAPAAPAGGIRDLVRDPTGTITALSAAAPGLGLMRYSGANIGHFHPLPPSRLLDTRPSSGGSGPIQQSGSLPVAGRGAVPDKLYASPDFFRSWYRATSVVLNVTVTEATAPSYLTVYPGNTTRPVASNLNFGPGQTVANLVTVKLGSEGDVSLFNLRGEVHVIVDVVGFYDSGELPGDLYSAAAPARVLDSRDGTGGYLSPWPARTGRAVQLTGVGGVPASASAVVVNLTGASATEATFLTAHSDNDARPNASNLNLGPGQVVPNLAVIEVGPTGKAMIYNHAGWTHVIADVVGWFGPDEPGQPGASGATFQPLQPARILDSRDGTGGYAAPWPEATARDVAVTGVGGVGGDATAVVLNVTVTAPTSPGYLTVFPAGSARPVASNLNFVAGQTVPNLVVAKVGAGGKVSIYNQAGWTHVVADVVGYYH